MPIVPGVIGCFACSGTDHFESACPEKSDPTEGATNRKAHEERIAKYVQWLIYDEPPRITPRQKQDLIKQEVKRYRDAVARERKAA